MPRISVFALALALFCVSAAPAAAAHTTSDTLALDDAGTLTWTVTGTAEKILNFRVPGDGCEWSDLSIIDCVAIEDVSSPQFSDAPAGCLGRDDDFYALIRCPLDGVAKLVLDARASAGGKIDVAHFGPGQTYDIYEEGYACSPVPLEIRQERGPGNVLADNGCTETIVCGAEYTGIVRADAGDAVAANCANLEVDDEYVRGEGPLKPFPEAPPTPEMPPAATPAPVPAATIAVFPPTAKPRKPAARPLVKIGVKAAKKRKLTVTVTLRKACTMTIKVQRSTAKGWKSVVTQKVKAKKGTVRRTLSAARGRSLAKGRYRVVVSSPDSDYDLVSSALSLR